MEQNNVTQTSSARSAKNSSFAKSPVSVGQAFSEYGKVPPQAPDLEEAVLGALMLEQNALTAVIDILQPQSFYKDAHKMIFGAIQRLFSRSEPIDILTVTNELKKSGELEIIGGPYYIAKLTNQVASTANVEYHARIITEKYIQRELIRISSEIIRDSFEETSDVFELLDSAEKKLFAVSDTNLRREYQDMRSLVIKAVKEIESIMNRKDTLRGVGTGFSDLDRITGGWQKSDLIVLAARPGMGKTAFVLSMARNIVLDIKIPVAVFSLEMSAIQLITRLISGETQLPAEKLRKGNLEQYEMHQLQTMVSPLMEAPLFIDDTPAINIFELRAKCRRMKQQHNIGLIIIDYLQLMTSGGESRMNREQEISNISRSLKSLAKELDVPIIALSQLNRMVEGRPNKKPVLSDLRESGAIEQDADIVAFIYRPEVYKIHEDENGNPTAGLAQIIIAKHRNGPLADVNLRFIASLAKFVEYGQGYYEAPEAASVDSDMDNIQQIRSITRQSKINDEYYDEDSEQDIPF